MDCMFLLVVYPAPLYYMRSHTRSIACASKPPITLITADLWWGFPGVRDAMFPINKLLGSQHADTTSFPFTANTQIHDLLCYSSNRQYFQENDRTISRTSWPSSQGHPCDHRLVEMQMLMGYLRPRHKILFPSPVAQSARVTTQLASKKVSQSRN